MNADMMFLFSAVPGNQLNPLLVFLLIIVGMIVLFALGNSIAKSLRMADYGWKIGVILITFVGSLILVSTKEMKFGIDLSGGTTLIYEVDQSQKKDKNEAVEMDKLVTAVSRRVNPGGQKEVIIRKYGPEQIQIIIPGDNIAEKERVKEVVSKTGRLEFRIVANDWQHKSEIELAKSEPNLMVYKDSKGGWTARWVPVVEEEKLSSHNHIRERTVGNRKIREVLVVYDVHNVSGDELASSRADVDQTNQPCVSFTFKPEGAFLFGELTSENLPSKIQPELKSQLGIILDGELCSAPVINDRITDRGQISGHFKQKDVDQLVDILNAGALPATLAKIPVQESVSEALLGADTIRKSSWAMILSAILVPLFMLVYYRFSGMIAIVALVLNILGIIAVMVTFNAAFTLTGFAALALTIGMAVDNNVLVYERMREELAKGAAIRMAIRNAFNRAGATIIDCNMTHIIVAVVLWGLGSDQMRGFAIPLLLGTVFSIFTSVFVSHVFFDIAERHHWVTKLKMLHVIGHTSIDFMGIFPVCAVFSVIITVLGLGAAYFRGQSLLDIDFTGGVSVQVLFEKPKEIGDLRSDLRKEKDLHDLEISNAKVGDEARGLRFNINTSNQSTDDVKAIIQRVYGPELAKTRVSLKNFGPATAPKAKAEPATPPKEPENQKPEEKPTPEKQSRSLRRSSNWIALAAASTLFFTQVDNATAQPPVDPPKAEKAADVKPVEPKADTKEKTDAKTETKPEVKPEAKSETPTETKPEAKTEAKPELKTETKPEIKSGSTPDESNPMAAFENAFFGGSQVDLQFERKVEQSYVKTLLNNTLKELKYTAENIRYEISGEGFIEDDPETKRLKLATWTIKIAMPQEEAKKVFESVEKKLNTEPYFPASNTIGGAVAIGTRVDAIYAVIASWLLIILYLWIRFQGVAFGLAAVIGLVHDVLVMLGAVAFSSWLASIPGVSEFLLIEPFKINLPIIVAFLTIIGYSVNDTIVVFDRIREIRGKDPNLTRKMVNDSTNQTLSRTIITSLTVFIVVVVLYLFGGPALRGFSFALIVGVITGTYSSIYVSAPILLLLIGKHKVSSDHPHYEPSKK